MKTSLVKEMYNAYRERMQRGGAGWQALETGQSLPVWELLPVNQQTAWKAAAGQAREILEQHVAMT